MKLIAAIGTAFLSLTIAVPAYAQQEQHDQQQDKPAKDEKHAQQQEKKAQPEKRQPQQEKQRAQQEKPQQEKPAQRDEQHAREAKPGQQNEHQAQQQNQHPQQQDHAQQQRGNSNDRPQRTPEQQRVQKSAMQQHRSHSWDSDHRTWQQRGGYNGYRIPDDHFRGYFGQDHGFRISGLPFLIVGGYPRFQYGGYWVSMVDPWPEYWGDDWYDNDDVYVVYVDNGYYLYNRRYPSVGIAINISM